MLATRKIHGRPGKAIRAIAAAEAKGVVITCARARHGQAVNRNRALVSDLSGASMGGAVMGRTVDGPNRARPGVWP
ncbi:hypothetical protein GCM10022247_06770 [Allokutzneria multivorans]|uniref:Uncharacterized protein n=1 Tax=Allokutzneria multivorans TaxID=1142134 RepID=A0ABP7R0H8_9PSEU